MEFRTLTGAVEGRANHPPGNRDVTSLSTASAEAVELGYVAGHDTAVEGIVLDWNDVAGPDSPDVRRHVGLGFENAGRWTKGVRFVSVRVRVQHVGPNLLRDFQLAGLQIRAQWLFAEVLRHTVPVMIAPAWRTADVLALARAVREDGAFDRLPVLADALMDAGCTLAPLLDHCRTDCDHGPACWVADLILGPEAPRVVEG